MAITFLCPNGHKLSCADERAGRAARCPECGATFRVPVPVESEPATNGGRVQGSGGEAAAAVSVADPEVRATESANGPQEQIVFLCPNGHRLYGPVSLEGKPGKCPHCQAKFLVPHRDAEAAEETGEAAAAVSDSGVSVNAAPSAAADDPHLDTAIRLQAPSEPVPGFPVFGPNWLSETSAPPADAPSIPDEEPPQASGATLDGSSIHPMAHLFGELWPYTSEGATIELHLAGGEVIVPERYAPELSRQSHGLFAIRRPGGAYTLVAVSWSTVNRVAVNGVEYLPAGLFE